MRCGVKTADCRITSLRRDGVGVIAVVVHDFGIFCSSRGVCVISAELLLFFVPILHAADNKMEENKVNDNECESCPCGSSLDSSRPVPITSVRNPSAAQPVPGGLASPALTVVVHPTTGGQFELMVDCNDTIEQLKKTISKRFKVAKERICLLHRDRDLREGSLLENGINDGSKITLLPMVETGLLAQRPEQSVLQALESLSDSQVNDFLSGRAPLNLTMRLGDHMMFIQLQLSTVGGQSSSSHASHQRRSAHRHLHHHHHHHRSSASSSTPSPPSASLSPSDTPSAPRSSRPPALLVASPAVPALDGQSCSGCRSDAPRISSSRRPSTSTAAAAAPQVAPSTSGSPPAVAALCSTDQCAGTEQPMTDVTHLLDTRTLAEASRNLSQTLRHLSSKALNVRGGDTKDCTHNNCSAARRQGAIIESMHHHGRGVYSGTFSGTLNPALQDRHGHPKRDISTIVHILNDLLGATPQYRRHNARHGLAITTGGSDDQATPSGSRAITSTAASTSKSAGTRTNRVTTPKEFDQENQATRGKVEQLQLMMEERRARRRARREARAPYPQVGGQSSATPAPTHLAPTVTRPGSSDGVFHCTADTQATATNTNTSTSTSGHQTATVQTLTEMPAEVSDTAVATSPAVAAAASSEGGTDTKVDAATPMDCDGTTEPTLDASNGYLKLNPETAVA